VPRDFPIRVWCLVKQDAAHRKAFFAETRRHELFNGFRNCYLAHYWNAQQIPLCVFGIAKMGAEMFHHLLSEALGDNCKPALFDALRDGP